MRISETHMLGFIVVFISSTLWPSLPNFYLISLAFILLIVNISIRLSAVLSGGIVGFLFACACIHYYTNLQFNAQFYNRDLLVEGEVLSLMPLHNSIDKLSDKTRKNRAGNPSQSENSIKLLVKLSQLGKYKSVTKPIVRLSWYAPNISVSQGDKVKLFVRLKPATGLANPNGFNYQKWLVSKNIAALGYVKTSVSNQILEPNKSLRQHLVNQLQLKSLNNTKWLLALTYGDRQLLDKNDWAMLQRTGTAHLFAISGMHLGIVFGFTLFVFRLFTLAVMRLCAITPRLNLYFISVPISVGFCVFYAYIAGMDVPVMRALLALVLWTFILLHRWYWQAIKIILCLLCSFLILFPYAILGISFWFSFTALGIILFYVWRFPLPPNSTFANKLWYALKLQICISFLSMPMIAVAFSTLPLFSFVANIFMIPIVTFILVPLSLFAAVLDVIGLSSQIVYSFNDMCFSYTFLLLELVDQHIVAIQTQQAVSEHVVTIIGHPLFIVFLVLVLLPTWQGKKIVLTFAVLSLFTSLFINNPDLYHAYFASPIKNNKLTMHAMDVGQGTSIIFEHFNPQSSKRFDSQYQTSKQYFIYDTGGAFSGFSMAESVLLPFFFALNQKQVELLMISHFDNDHAGGAHILQNALNIKQTIHPTAGCNVADNPHPIVYGQMQIQVLWPLVPMKGDVNDQSCVVRIRFKQYTILLAGDIEAKSEAKLLAHYSHHYSHDMQLTATEREGRNEAVKRHLLRADILVAPHHGSITSSSPAFVDAVRPKFVIFTAGLNNRWGFPATQVLDRYKAVEHKSIYGDFVKQNATQLYVTGQDGRITLKLTKSGIKGSRFRQDEFRRWYLNTQ